MPEFKKNALLNELTASVAQIVNDVKALPLDNDLLNRQPGVDKWSVLQVLAHLNFYNKSYLPKLEMRLGKRSGNELIFKTGWLGNYFTNMMLPKPDGSVTSKMSAPKDSRPESNLDAQQVICEFLAGEEQLLSLLERASKASLNTRVPTSISSLIKLKAGDTFRFLVAHQQRHLIQLKRTLNEVK